MSMPFSVHQESDSNPQIYSRKDKSLGLITSNFLKLYDCHGIGIIGLDDAAKQLGVQRRRMYDVVNILESVGIVSRKAKNQYSWKGFKAIPQALEELKAEGMKEKSDATSQKVLCNRENGACSSQENDNEDNPFASSNIECRRERSSFSLAHLTENFIKHLLCSDVDFVLLEEAAKIMPGDSQNPTKVRRLYDIANVLSAINLIEKTNHPENRKTAYRWLGPDHAIEHNVSKKRMFGTEITNSSLKRNKPDSLVDQKLQSRNMPMDVKRDDFENKGNGKFSEQPPTNSSKAIDFGPFAPYNPRREDPENKRLKQILDLETLSSKYRPEYCNKALSDLFAHYMEAWKSWFDDAAAKQQISSWF
ncbi:hypothetical protein L6164_005888 [Bauhinia variegata]|uniref:Uncharacterized protein n=1 Tax=Bauhinia variegata TaxID=167791 RepID=A0ACB9PSN9_BAUVA|nr:hypothetical protein L6164_005888 [Bauhinia variegata]